MANTVSESMLPIHEPVNAAKSQPIFNLLISKRSCKGTIMIGVSFLLEMVRSLTFIMLIVLSYRFVILSPVRTLICILSAPSVIGTIYVLIITIKSEYVHFIAFLRSFDICVSMFVSIFFLPLTIFVPLVVPSYLLLYSTQLTWKTYSRNYHDEYKIPDLDSALFMTKLVEYCGEHPSPNERSKRVIVTNYYLQCMFHDQLSDDCIKDINQQSLTEIYNLYKSNNTAFGQDIRWKDMMHKSKHYYDKSVTLGHYLYIWSVIQFVATMTCLTVILNDIHFGRIVSWIIYLFLEFINYKLHVDLTRIALYSYCLILPHFTLRSIKSELKWDDIFESTDLMMNQIHGIYRAMFDPQDTVHCLHEIIDQECIVDVIKTFLWFPLPTAKIMNIYRALAKSKPFDAEIVIH